MKGIIRPDQPMKTSYHTRQLPTKPKNCRSLIQWYDINMGVVAAYDQGPTPGSMQYNARMKMNEKLTQRYYEHYTRAQGC